VGCDQTSIQTALDNAGTNSGLTYIQVKNGTYGPSSPLKVPSGAFIVIQGGGRNTLIQCNRSSVKTCLELSDPTTVTTHLVLRDMTFQMTGSGTGGTCVDFSHVEIFDFDGVNCLTAANGFVASSSLSSFYGSIANGEITIDGGYGAATSSVGIGLMNAAGNDTIIQNMRIRPISAISSSTCYYIDSHDVTIKRGDCETNALYGLYVTKNGWDF